MDEFTTKEKIVFYTKRFLKVAVPLAIVIVPLAWQARVDWSTAGWLAIVPLLTTLDKYLRDNGWYAL